MIGMELVTELVKTVILTGKIANEQSAPVSLLLIAPPEHGKTSVLMSEKCEPMLLLNDLTGTGVREIAAQMDRVTHIALLDLLMATAHKSKANQFLMANIAAICEEGFIGEATPDGLKQMKEPVKKAFICCMTGVMVKDGRHYWNKVGITSRMMPFNYLFSTEQTNKIREAINHSFNGNGAMPKQDLIINLKGFKTPAAPIRVKYSKKWIAEIDIIAYAKSLELGDPKGFRRVKQFHALACAHAILRTWKKPEVTERDVQFVRRIQKYISYTKGCEL